ncbi:MAG: Tetratricopeptide 1 repeat-containing protein [Chthonomonadales bacterium]|nr:Tetratricopeptide 1 repeat-containing protein [Chthonomonadales bacterium]
MQLRDRQSGNLVTLETAAPLGRGGEAQVYPVLGRPESVAKIYAPGKATTERAHKLVVMMANAPEAPQSGDDHVPLAWPQSLLTRPDDANAVVGFLMPRAHAVAQAIDYYNPQRRREICPLFDYRYLLRTARNLAAATRSVHSHGYVIGDLKHSNVLVSETALVTLVDTDSFQVRDPLSGRIYPCQVGTPDYTPPERQHDLHIAAPLTPEHDLFALGVLIFQMLMEGTHPFAGVYTGEGDPPPFEERIAAGHFPYGANPGPYRPGKRTAPPFENLPPTLQALFLQCFEAGHADPTARPDAQTWQSALDETCRVLHACPANPHHFYSSHLGLCPWCERRDTQLRGLDPFPPTPPVAQSVPRPEIFAPIPFHPPPAVPQTPMKTLPIHEFKQMLGWVGALFVIVSGLCVFTGQMHPELSSWTIDGDPRRFADGQTQSTDATPVAPDENSSPSITVYSPSGNDVASYDFVQEKILIERFPNPHRVSEFAFPNQKFRSMKFSNDGESLLITKQDGSKARWNIAHKKFQ